jgi:uncharacterized protein (TIGR03118 family)
MPQIKNSLRSAFMINAVLFKSVIPTAVAIGALCVGARLAEAADYTQTNLVSDVPGLAKITDPTLQNSWGVSFSGMLPFWVSNQVTNTATLYAVTGRTNVTKVDINPPSDFVAIPTTASGPQGPTGQVANTNMSSFDVRKGGDGKSALFIFANLNGTISAWDGGTSAFIQKFTQGALYTGLAINQAQTRLYAANGAGTGSVDVFDRSFNPVNLGAHAFETGDEIAARHLVPFNVRDLDGDVYVTYAPAGHAAQTTAAEGDGAVAVFNENGVRVRNRDGDRSMTLLGGSDVPLAAPWGVAIAPASFGKFAGDLLVGNFSFAHSGIDAFDRKTGKFEGTIKINPGAGNTAGGLWALTFGTEADNGGPNTLYFTDGIDGEVHGLFGAIIPSVPKP